MLKLLNLSINFLSQIHLENKNVVLPGIVEQTDATEVSELLRNIYFSMAQSNLVFFLYYMGSA